METKITEPAKSPLTADQFLARMKPKTKIVSIPGVGDVTIKGVTITERGQIKSGATATLNGKTDEEQFAALTILKGLVEPKLTPAHVSELLASNFGACKNLADEIWILSGVGGDEKNA